jgi:hypothetical protein
VQLDCQETQVIQVLRVHRDRRVIQDCRVYQEIQVILELRVRKDQKVLQVLLPKDRLQPAW